jgi:hypothetical protein
MAPSAAREKSARELKEGIVIDYWLTVDMRFGSAGDCCATLVCWMWERVFV